MDAELDETQIHSEVSNITDFLIIVDNLTVQPQIRTNNLDLYPLLYNRIKINDDYFLEYQNPFVY